MFNGIETHYKISSWKIMKQFFAPDQTPDYIVKKICLYELIYNEDNRIYIGNISAHFNACILHSVCNNYNHINDNGLLC